MDFERRKKKIKSYEIRRRRRKKEESDAMHFVTSITRRSMVRVIAKSY